MCIVETLLDRKYKFKVIKNMIIYKIIKFILTFSPLIWLAVLIEPREYKEFWEYAWNILLFIMFIRPIKDIFPEYKILWKAVALRKELWILSASLAIAHVAWYFLANWLPVTFLFDSILWNPRWYLWWGMFAFIISLILLWTSNIFSMKKLWKYWKPIQRLSYLMLLFVAIHIAMVEKEYIYYSLIILAYVIVYMLAYYLKNISHAK